MDRGDVVDREERRGDVGTWVDRGGDVWRALGEVGRGRGHGGWIEWMSDGKVM